MIPILSNVCREVELRLMVTECRKRGCKVYLCNDTMIVPDNCGHECRVEMIAYIKGFFRGHDDSLD